MEDCQKLCTLFDLVSEFQTAIVGVIGFAGIIIVQILNARHARKQSEREFDGRKIALKTSLLAEIRFFKDMFERGLKDEPPADFEDAIGGRYKRELSVALARDFGLLEKDLSETVLNGLMMIDEADLRMVIIAKETTAVYFVITAKNWSARSAILKGAIPPLEVAIEALEISFLHHSAKA